MASLYSIGADLEALNNLLTEIGGDISDADTDAAVTAWFMELASGEAVKLDGYAGLIRRLEGEAEQASREAREWSAKAAARTNAARRLKDRLKHHIEYTGRKKITTASGRVLSVKGNGGKLPLAIDTVDPLTLPASFVRFVPQVNTDGVREALEAGESLPWARLLPRGTHLKID